MSTLTDRLLVGALVLAAVWYAARALGPRAWRRRAGPRASGSCGGCDSCATGGTTGTSPGADIRVPLTEIGHRTPASRNPGP